MSAVRAIVVDPRDNVAVVLVDVPAAAEVLTDAGALLATEPVPQGHKLALREIAAGDAVVKYGATIGVARTAIVRGAHVHVHNLESARLRGDR
jgi:SAF domain